MGVTNSRHERLIAELPEQERYFGLENFGNTCYSNSVLQSLYFCRPFREAVLKHAEKQTARDDENLLNCLADLFQTISTQKKKSGVIAPKKFIQTLKKNNELFRSFAHQDAHEFLNYLLNECSELLEKEQKERTQRIARQPATWPANGTVATPGTPPAQNGNEGPPPQTWIHDLFQGKLVNETRCMRCETVTSREEAFYDLSLEIEQNSSITSCLRQFSSTEMLNADDKFFCDQCQSLQEAEKRMVIRQLPRILCLHLKRFKYIEQIDRLRKLMYRVVFPFELKLRNTVDECPEADDLYNLFSVVVHVGAGPNHGHYVSFVKSHEHWLLLDDETVEPIDEQVVQTAFGSTNEYQHATNQQPMEHGYILLYERQLSEP